MPVIAILGNKGGAGKTTLSINLANILAEYGSTTLLDADVQQSSHQWFQLSNIDTGLEVIKADKDLANLIAEARQNCDNLVIDCPPSIYAKQTQQALLHSDIALIPVLPSPLDMWASVKIEEELAKVASQNPSLAPWLVINQMEPRTRLSQAIRNAMAELSIKTASTTVRRRMAYRLSVLDGKSVNHLGAKGRAATLELTELLQELGLIS